MTYVTEYAIEETMTHAEGAHKHFDRFKTYNTYADAVAVAKRSEVRFSENPATAGAKLECKVVPVEMGFANLRGYSDVTPFEIVRVISDKTIEVREMNAEMASDWRPEMVSGGFAFHCTNNDDQRKAWVVTRNPDAPVVRLRLQKNGAWRNPSYGRFFLSERPVKKYDFNF